VHDRLLARTLALGSMRGRRSPLARG
jgi:hypothetical protein